jgi:acyl-CoA thioester hydrolase
MILVRIAVFLFCFENGITARVMNEHEIGPVLFREECFFKREIVFGDEISISLRLKSVSKDFQEIQHAA